MEKEIVSKNQLVNSLLHIGHGNLSIYTDIGLKAVQAEPELFAHLIAWNAVKGEVRDSKTAFPVLALRGEYDKELFENAGCHLYLLSPRDLLKASFYHRELPGVTPLGGKTFKFIVEQFIRNREQHPAWWNATAVQHRSSLKSLYSLYHIKPSKRAQDILFKRIYPKNSVFEKIAQLKNMDAQTAAGTILTHKIPFLVAVGALGGIKDKTDIILALIEAMTGNELITNSAMLKKLSVFENNALKSAYDKAVEKTAKANVSTLKAGRAAAAVSDKKLVKKLDQIQEKKLAQLGGIEGDWLVLGDCSGSMHHAITASQRVAALIAQQVKGSVHLIFFNTMPHPFDVSNKTLSEIEEMTKRVRATGGTSIGCGLDYLMQKNVLVNGVVIITDCQENQRPFFSDVYNKYVAKMGLEPTVYVLRIGKYPTYFVKDLSTRAECFDIDEPVDYYSLPNIVRVLRSSRYSLVDEIMETSLKKYSDYFNVEGGKTK